MYTTGQKFEIIRFFNVYEISVFLLIKTAFIWSNMRKNSNILKYYYNLKNFPIFIIWKSDLFI